MKAFQALFGFLVLAVAFHLEAGEKMTAEEKWSIQGSYSETCQCYANCVCLLGSLPTGHDHFCDSPSNWKIEKGYYGKTPLDGLNVALVLESPMGQSVVGSVGNWNLMATYIDERATPEQRESLSRIFSKIIGSKLAKVEKTSYVPIHAEHRVDSAKVEIPNILKYEIMAVKGKDGKTYATLSNTPISFAGINTMTIAKSTIHSYNDHGFMWNYKDRSGFLANFNYNSEDYAKESGATK